MIGLCVQYFKLVSVVRLFVIDDVVIDPTFRCTSYDLGYNTNILIYAFTVHDQFRCTYKRRSTWQTS